MMISSSSSAYCCFNGCSLQLPIYNYLQLPHKFHFTPRIICHSHLQTPTTVNPLSSSSTTTTTKFSELAEAGFLSGSTGLEPMPGPELPRIGFLDRFNQENQKRYAENDERIKSSPIVKELLERSKKNKEKNKQEILDKYCLRGAEWGVGDCSTAGMTNEERDSFITMLKQKAAAAAAADAK